MKLFLLVALLLVSGCSILGSGRDIPEVKPVEVVTVVKEAPMYHPPLPIVTGKLTEITSSN